MTPTLTASQLYNALACPHRVSMDAFADPARRDEPNAFVELLIFLEEEPDNVFHADASSRSCGLRVHTAARPCRIADREC